MNMSRLLSRAVLTIFVVSIPAYAQQLNRAQVETNPKTTPAYSLLVQRRVKVQAELETVLAE